MKRSFLAKWLAVPAVLAPVILSMPARAHLDTLTQVIEPDPLVRAFEAEALPRLGTVEAVEDIAASGRQAVVLKGEGAGLKVDLGDLGVGMHALYLVAKVTQENAWEKGVRNVAASVYDGSVQGRPLYVQLRVNSGVGGTWEEHRLRVPFDKQFVHMVRIYFHTPEARAYSAEVTIGARSRITQLIVDAVEVRNPLGALQFQAFKSKPVLFTADERRQLLLSAAKEETVPAALRPRELPDAARAERDAVLWNAVMPLNANPGNIYGSVGRGNPLLEAIMKAQEAKLGRKLGTWTGETAFDKPWRLENKELGLAYTLDDYNAGRILPAPWPFAEDKGGYYFDKAEWNVETSFNYGVVPTFIQQRYHAVLAALGAWPERREGSLVARYFLLGDLEAGADAALLLAAFAYRYPAYDWNVQCMENIYPQGRTFNPSNVFGRGCSYEGWSTPEIEKVLEAYDKLFPYIQDNDRLAARVGRFVPWVKTPADVVRLLDTFLVQRAAQDGLQHILYAPIITTAASVLGPNAASQKYLDALFSRTYQRETLCGFPDMIEGGFSRDGANFIGSTYYVVGESKGELFDTASLLARYVRAGGDKRYNLADPRLYPRLAATADTLLRLHVAGGFRPGIGDVHDPMAGPQSWINPKEDGEFLLQSYRWTRNATIAWALATKIGQGSVPQKEWDEITKAAATVRDPIVHSASTLLEGYGMATLEEGVDAADRRQKNAIMFRFGVASGHAHADTLDYEIYAHGCRMSSDLGGREANPKYGKPNCLHTFVHNVVEVDEKNFNGGRAQNATAAGWVEAFKPFTGAQAVIGGAQAENLPQVSLYNRALVQVMCDPGNGRDVTPTGYVFDIFRVAGGSTHTWCYHGCVSEQFTTNAGLQPATSNIAKKYLSRHLGGTATEGTAPDVLEATWLLRRTEETLNEIPLKNAEKRILAELYDEAAPRKLTRVALFGQAGAKVMSANFYSRDIRQYNFPMLYVRRDGAEGLASTFVSLVEPYAGDPFIAGKRQLKVEGAGEGVHQAVALEVTTRYGQTDMLFGAEADGRVFTVEGGARASGRLALASRDAQGLRLLHLVGGSELTVAGVSVQLTQPAYRTTVASADYAGRKLRLKDPFPARLLDGEYLDIGNDLQRNPFHALAVKDNEVTLERTARIYTGGVTAVDPAGGHAVLDLEPYLISYHPHYYDGTTLVNEAGQVMGQARVTLGGRFWYTGWPAARRHLARIMPEDLADANGDGRRMLTMIAREPGKKFGPDGETPVPVAAGEKMFELEVTRLRDDGLMFWTKDHPRTFLDALNVAHPGWPYHQQLVRNERGDRDWVVNMPGDSYQVRVAGRTLREADFPDTDGNGRRQVSLQHYGPGDRVTALTHLYLRRLAAGRYELRANAGCRLVLPGKQVTLSDDGGKSWRDCGATAQDGKVTLALTAADLGAGRVELQVTP